VFHGEVERRSRLRRRRRRVGGADDPSGGEDQHDKDQRNRFHGFDNYAVSTPFVHALNCLARCFTSPWKAAPCWPVLALFCSSAAPPAPGGFSKPPLTPAGPNSLRTSTTPRLRLATTAGPP